tara:strand:- start:178 stop:759 length:582 start_codon:yes stop_codon:yes gene_type:complete
MEPITVTRIVSLFHEFQKHDFTNHDFANENETFENKLKKRTSYKSKALLLATNNNILRHEIQKRIGIQEEDRMLDICENAIGKKISRRNDELYSIEIENGDQSIIVQGKIDGYIQEDSIVIEHKRRTRGLLNRVPYHEKVQCHFYMKMKNCNKCYLLETFGDHINTHVIYFDQNTWEEICIRLFLLSDFILKK